VWCVNQWGHHWHEPGENFWFLSKCLMTRVNCFHVCIWRSSLAFSWVCSSSSEDDEDEETWEIIWYYVGIIQEIEFTQWSGLEKRKVKGTIDLFCTANTFSLSLHTRHTQTNGQTSVFNRGLGIPSISSLLHFDFDYNGEPLMRNMWAQLNVITFPHSYIILLFPRDEHSRVLGLGLRTTNPWVIISPSPTVNT